MSNSITAPGFSCATSVGASWLRERKNILDIVAAYVGGLGSTSIETALADDYARLESESVGPNDKHHPYPVQADLLLRDWWAASEREASLIRGADDCQHEIVNGDGGGIRCRRCDGWFCF